MSADSRRNPFAKTLIDEMYEEMHELRPRPKGKCLSSHNAWEAKGDNSIPAKRNETYEEWYRRVSD